MNITENLRRDNQKKRKVYSILILAGILLLVLTPILMDRLLPVIIRVYSQSTRPKYMEIVIPDSAMEHKSKPDSVLSLYLLGHDSVVLHYKRESVIVNIQNIDTFLNKTNFKYLLIKPSPNSGYNLLVTTLDKVGEAHIKYYTVTDFNKNELDSVLKIKN